MGLEGKYDIKQKETAHAQDVKKIKLLLPEFIRQYRDTFLELVQQDTDLRGEVGGDVRINKTKGKEKLGFEQQENYLWSLAKGYVFSIERIRDGTYAEGDLELLGMFLKDMRTFLGDSKNPRTRMVFAMQQAQEKLLRKARGDSQGTSKIPDMESPALLRQMIYEGFVFLIDEGYLPVKSDPHAIATLHLHKDLKAPSEVDIAMTKMTGGIEIVIAYTLFSIVPYIVHDGKVEKLDEIDLVPARKK